MIRKILYTSTAVFVFVLVLIFPQYSHAATGSPVGKISYLTDQGVYGSVYDPDCPGSPVSIHVYPISGEPGVICQSGFSCPWGICPPSVNNGKTGFWCLYRRPIDSVTALNKSQINVTALNTCGGGENVQLNDPGASPQPTITNYHQREINTIFIDKPDYNVGISKRYGGAIVEFYNKRIDPSMNLINPDPGAALNVAIFGTDTIGSTPNCVGTNDLRYNPIQTGSHCPAGTNPPVLNSVIEECYGDGQEVDCGNMSNLYNGHQLKFKIHFRNFYYPLASSYPYAGFDDIYGFITYTFEQEYVQIDYQLWKITGTTFGESFQQLPVVFTQQLTKFIYKQKGQMITSDAPYISSTNDFIENNTDGRWITTMMSSNNPIYNGNFLTLAFYNKPFNNICPARKFQMDYLTNDGNAQFNAAIQNNLTFLPQMNNYIEFRTLVFPFKHNENLPGTNKTVGTMADSYASNGGLMPDWECNMPFPTPTPTSTPTPTPTPTPKPGDLNGDGKVDIRDYAIFVLDFGNTTCGKVADIDSSCTVDIFDYNVLVGNWGKERK